MKEENTAEPKEHEVRLEGRERILITGVVDVGMFHEQMIVAVTSQGKLTLTGQGLHVGSLNLEEGILTAEGRIDAVSYDEHVQKQRGVWGRVFR